MEVKDFKRIARLLKDAYASLQEEALNTGVDIFSAEYKQAINRLREEVLARSGFTLQEYTQVRNQLEADRLATKEQGTLSADLVIQAREALIKLRDVKIPTEEEITTIAHHVAKEYIKPPVVTNQIVKETTKEVIVEKPQIIETTRVVNTPYNDKNVNDRIDALTKEFQNIQTAEPFNPEPLAEELKQFFEDNFHNNFKHNIDILGMPDWRKLAMGLREDIDKLTNAGSGHTIEDEGTILPARKYLNFIGAGVTASDDSANNATKVTIPGGGSSTNFADSEAPTDSGDHTNFTLANTPTVGSVKLYRGGARQQVTGDYTISGGTLTLSYSLQTGEVLLADYRY